MARVLLVEKNHGVSRGLLRTLSDAGHDVGWAQDHSDALRQAAEQQPGVVLLEVSLSGGDDFVLCRRLRRTSPYSAIVIVAPRDAKMDALAALDAGADDYLAKPVRLAELLDRVTANLRRVAFTRSRTLRAGDVEVDLLSRQASVAGDRLPLEPEEFELLALLVSEAGVTLPRGWILDEAWTTDRSTAGATEMLDLHVAALCRKLDDAGAGVRITTHRRAGYRLDAETPAPE